MLYKEHFGCVGSFVGSPLCAILKYLCMDVKVRDDGGVDFINEGRGARLRVFAALKHRYLKQVLQPLCTCLLLPAR